MQSSRRAAVAVETVPLDWYKANVDSIAKADALIGAQLADRRRLGEHTVMSLCDEVFTVMKRSLSTDEAPENSSVLLLGESGSGKTHIVEWCVERLREVQSSLVVLRAHGGNYTTDVECLRHLAAQVADQLVFGLQANASFEQSMDWVRSVLKESFRHAGAVVVVLDKFEHFCSKTRQTLLYNLFDIAQEVGVRLSIIGTSEKMAVMQSLEKRIRSRFSMRHLHVFLPSDIEELIAVLMAKLRLAPDCGLKPAFLAKFHRHVELALRWRAQDWRAELDVGRPPNWFLWQCLPVSSLLSACASHAGPADEGPRQKRQRAATATTVGCQPSVTTGTTRCLMLSSLSEVEHIVLLGFFRLRDRREATNISRLLLELQTLHEVNQMTFAFSKERYSAAFDRLLRANLVEFVGSGNKDAAKRYSLCRSLVDDIYQAFVKDLELSTPVLASNPLRLLPAPVQQWAVRRRLHA